MLKTLLIYVMVIAGIAAIAGTQGASHITEQAMQRWEQQQ